MHKVCVKAVGLFEGVVCLEIEECISIEDLITRVFSIKGIRTDLESIAVSDGLRTLKLSEDACSHKELAIFRLFRGG